MFRAYRALSKHTGVGWLHIENPQLPQRASKMFRAYRALSKHTGVGWLHIENPRLQQRAAKMFHACRASFRHTMGRVAARCPPAAFGTGYKAIARPRPFLRSVFRAR
jgi:hypothetical protein